MPTCLSVNMQLHKSLQRLMKIGIYIYVGMILQTLKKDVEAMKQRKHNSMS